MTMSADLDWIKLGEALRESADDVHEGETPSVDLAYSFLLDNPECFTEGDEWPPDMPQHPPIELIGSYYPKPTDDGSYTVYLPIEGGLERLLGLLAPLDGRGELSYRTDTLKDARRFVKRVASICTFGSLPCPNKAQTTKEEHQL